MGLLKKIAKVATGGILGSQIGALGDALKGPKPPDPNDLTTANMNEARFNARLGRMNQKTPFGSRTYTDLGNDRWEMTDSLDQADQANLDRRRSLAGQWGGMADPNSFTKLPGVDDFGAERDSLTDSVYNRYTRTMDPRFQREGDALRNRLVNQGVMEGSEAWKNAMSDFNTAKDTAYADAMDRAVTAGASEQSRLFGLSLAGRQQGVDEFGRAMDYLTPMTPQFEGAPDAGIPVGATAGYMQDAYNAKQANRNNLMQGALGLGSLFMLSDRRAKTDIRRVGKLDTGLPVYSYRYKGDAKTQIGVMAQEVEKVIPDAVVTGDDGLKRVDYSQL